MRASAKTAKAKAKYNGLFNWVRECIPRPLLIVPNVEEKAMSFLKARNVKNVKLRKSPARKR